MTMMIRDERQSIVKSVCIEPYGSAAILNPNRHNGEPADVFFCDFFVPKDRFFVVL